ncbi:MAG: zinc ribbon domain-containing protein [Atopobium sp.]|uniref:zinc ribbon domain-containing protein n=1 Tax=Atopobium sp. TaxID=1872650 RepID=UPI002A7F14EC|nr:zinc ribbon domain-containing protein [Atopobium sp.]MDY4523001.1 zinc ribbon domain-containing protein [Atopobium sp.]
MFCSQCGVKNSDEAKFCTSCGASLHSATVHTSAAEPSDSTVETNPVAENKQDTKTSVDRILDSAENGARQITESLAKKHYRSLQERTSKENICVLAGFLGSILGCITPFCTFSIPGASHSVNLIKNENGILIVGGAVAALVFYNMYADKRAAIFSGITAFLGFNAVFTAGDAIYRSRVGVFFTYEIGYYLLFAASVAFAVAAYLIYKDLKKSK